MTPYRIHFLNENGEERITYASGRDEKDVERKVKRWGGIVKVLRIYVSPYARKRKEPQ